MKGRKTSRREERRRNVEGTLTLRLVDRGRGGGVYYYLTTAIISPHGLSGVGSACIAGTRTSIIDSSGSSGRRRWRKHQHQHQHHHHHQQHHRHQHPHEVELLISPIHGGNHAGSSDAEKKKKEGSGEDRTIEKARLRGGKPKYVSQFFRLLQTIDDNKKCINLY